MPKRTRTTEEVITNFKRKFRRQAKDKRRRQASLLTRNQKLLAGFPSEAVLKLRYFDAFSLSFGAGAVGSRSFKSNGCNDPDDSIGGHQPMNWDLWVQMYNHYTVLSSTIEVTANMPSIAAGNYQPIWGIYLDDNATITASNYTGIVENSGGPYDILPAYNSINHTLRHKFNAKDFWNVKDPVGKDSIGAAVTSDPADQGHFVIWVTNPNGTASTVNIQFTIDIEYTVKFYEPKDQLSS